MRSIKSHIRKTKFNCLLIVCFALPFSSAVAEVFDLGGMYTYHYHDGRYADWGDYARHGARIAIEEVNASGMLGDDQLRLKPENTIDYHCWPEGAATMAETLMKKGVLAITGADCSGPAVEIANMAAQYNIPVISNGANASMLSSTEDFPWFVRVVTPSEAYEGHLIDVADHFGVTEIGYLHTTDAWGSVHEKLSETTPSGTASISERNSVSRVIPITKLLKRMWPRFGMRAFDTSS